MKILLKIYSASCLIVVAFFAVLSVPWWESLPVSDAAAMMIFGGVILAVVTAYLLRVRSTEAFDFGYFLAAKGGFWAITAACFGIFCLLSGLLLYFIPQMVEPAFERGAWPVAAMLAVLFWLALVFMFALLTFTALANATSLLRVRKIKSALGSFAIGVVCLALAALFFSLFSEMISDVFIRLSAGFQSVATWTFASLLVVIAVVDGMICKIDNHLGNKELQ